MKHKLLAAIILLSLSVFGQPVFAAEQATATAELQDLITKVRAKLQESKNTEADLADELKQFDALLAKHKDEKTDDVAQVLLMKAMIYLQVLDNSDKAIQLVKQLKSDFPDTKQGKGADELITQIKRQGEAKKMRESLVAGSKFPDFDEKDLQGKPLSVANYKGKVVLIDFWATWCPPCRAEVPNVVKTYEKHHAKGFEIIGVSLDRDQDKEKLASFLKEKNMTWQQYYDGKYWQNKLAAKYGVQSIPATFLLDGEGKIIGKDLRGEALEDAVAKALAKN